MNKQIKHSLVCLFIIAVTVLISKLYYFKTPVEHEFDGVVYANIWGDFRLYSRGGKFLCNFDNDSPYPTQIKQIANDKWEILITSR